MEDGETIYLEKPPELRRAGDAIHLVARSGRRSYPFAMDRATFHQMVDQALAILTGPGANGATVAPIRREGRKKS